jgi:hypothetical protein
MNLPAISATARDIANHAHPQTNRSRHREIGPVVLNRRDVLQTSRPAIRHGIG